MYLSERASDLFPEASFAVAHCNFSLRGAESDADEDFVRKWCSDKGLTLYCRRFDTASEAESAGESIEMAARRLRYRWFAQLCSSEGFDAVAVAHKCRPRIDYLGSRLAITCSLRPSRLFTTLTASARRTLGSLTVESSSEQQ